MATGGPVTAQYVSTTRQPWRETERERPDTSAYEELIKLCPEEYKYMVTSNLNDEGQNRVEFWSTLEDLYVLRPGKPLRYANIYEFSLKISQQLRVRGIPAEVAVYDSYIMFVQFGLHNVLVPMERRSLPFHENLEKYVTFANENPLNLPAHELVIRFHVQFKYPPPGHPAMYPNDEQYNFVLSELEAATDPRPAKIAAPAQDATGRPSLEDLRPTTSLGQVASNLVGQMTSVMTNSGKAAFMKMRAKIAKANEKPPREVTSLESLGPEVGRPGIYNLNGFLPVTNVEDVEDWLACCRLVPDLNPAALLQDIQARSVKIFRSQLYVTPPQFYSAVTMLNKGSLFLAHDMGIGKTHTVLAALALRSRILTMKSECNQAWSRSTPNQTGLRHLPSDATHGACPLQGTRPGDVLCYCVPGGITRRLGDSLTPGAAIVQFPANARAEWMRAADQAEFNNRSYDFTMVSSSADVPTSLRKGPGEVERFARHWKVIATTTYRPQDKGRKDVIPDDVDLVATSIKEHWDRTVYMVAIGTSQLWRSLFSHPVTYRNQELKGQTIYSAPIGLSVIDEAHNPALWGRSGQGSPEVYAMELAHNRTSSQHWYVTGTPIPATPFESLLDMERPMRVLQLFKQDTISHFDEVYQKALRSKRPDDFEVFMRHFDDIFTRDLVLRFLHTSTFFGSPVSSIRHEQPVVSSSRMPNEAFLSNQALADRARRAAAPVGPPARGLGHNVHARIARERLYFASMFPHTAAEIDKGILNVEDDYFRDEIRKLPNRNNLHELPIVQKYFNLVAGHETIPPKVAAIIADIREMYRASSPRIPAPVQRKPLPGKTAAATPHRMSKMVIVTPTVATAVFLTFYLGQARFQHDVFPDYVPMMIHQDLTLAERANILRRFSSETTPSWNVLIGTFDTIGTATNLQRANWQILTSPLPLTRAVAQAFGRTNRTGQRADRVHHKILVLEESPVDRANLCAIAQRDIKSDVYNMRKGLELR